MTNSRNPEHNGDWKEIIVIIWIYKNVLDPIHKLRMCQAVVSGPPHMAYVNTSLNGWSCGMRHHVIWYMFINILEEHTASIFRVEDWGSRYLQNVRNNPPDHRHHISEDNLCSFIHENHKHHNIEPSEPIKGEEFLTHYMTVTFPRKTVHHRSRKFEMAWKTVKFSLVDNLMMVISKSHKSQSKHSLLAQFLLFKLTKFDSLYPHAKCINLNYL